MGIVRDDYIPGGFKRKEYKGSFLYYQYEMGGVFVDNSRERKVVQDVLVERLLDEKLISKRNFNLYIKFITKIFSDMESLESMSDEEIFGLIYDTRIEYLKEKPFKVFFDKIRNNFFEENVVLLKKESFQKILEDFFKDVKIRIDKKEILEENLKTRKKVILIPGSFRVLPFLARIIFNNFLENDIEVSILLKRKRVLDEPTPDDLDFLFSKLNLQPRGVNILTYDFKGVGLDLKRVNFQEYPKDSVVIGFEERSMFSLHGALFDYFIITTIESPKAMRYTNLFKHEGKTGIIGYVPSGTFPAVRWQGNERPIMSFYYFDRILDSIGKVKELSNKEEIHKIAPWIYINYYSNEFENMKKIFTFRNPKDFNELLRKREKFLCELVKKNLEMLGGGIYTWGFYRLPEFSKTVDFLYEVYNSQNGVIFHGILFRKNVNLLPVLAEELDKDLISPREYPLNEKYKFYFNFLYFFTDFLRKEYNRLRKSRQPEQLKIRNFFIDYRKYQGKETFPLYNKAFVAQLKNGKIMFGRRQLLGGKIKLNEFTISWSKEQVNPKTIKGQEFVIYTPIYMNEILSKEKIDFSNFKLEVGKNRLNVVIVNNEVVCIRVGEVFLPCVGVVLSFKKDILNILIREWDLYSIGNGYYASKEPLKVILDLEKPVEIEEDLWKRIKWAFGGGTILVREGENLMADELKAKMSFMEEGWYHPLSMQTQETQVQRWVRGPRTVIGLTKDEKFFIMVFDGRSKESVGARFDEIVIILEKEIGNLKWAMNLDGGSSSCFGLIHEKKFFELSTPSVSKYTSKGLVRPVNSFVLITT